MKKYILQPGHYSRGKGTRHRGNPLRLQWRTSRGRYNGGAFTKTVIDATMCAIIACSFVTSDCRFGSNLAYITSVFIGYIGTDSIGSLIKRFAAKKAGVEDGRNNNQRKAFLDMLAWSEELITDVRKPEIMVMTSL